MPSHRLSKAIVSQVGQFVQTLGKGCAKPSQKFLRAMLLGMAMSGSVMLSQSARKLKNITSLTFHAQHKKLCRGLKSKQWAALSVQEAYLKEAGKSLPRDAVVACDLGDITKPRARKMPGLRTVKDGSTGQLKRGWWLVEIEAVFGKGKHLPLWLELFSVGRRGYKSQRVMVQMAITVLVQHLGALGLWLFDRGFDNWRFFEFLETLKLKFLVRVKSNRIVLDLRDGTFKSLAKVARSLTPDARFLWGRRSRGYVIRVAFTAVVIPQNGQALWLVVAWGFGRQPLLLFTNRPVLSGLHAVKLVRAYLMRWGVEEAGRLIKQAFKLEDLRVLTWQGLVKLVWLTMWAYGLLCMFRLKAKRIYEHLLASYPSFGPAPKFAYYRIAGGLAYVLLLASLTQGGGLDAV